jgi:small basic protein
MIPLVGLLAGIVLGIVLEPSIPQILQPYLPIAIVAAMDALFGAFRAYLEGTFTDRGLVGRIAVGRGCRMLVLLGCQPSLAPPQRADTS